MSNATIAILVIIGGLAAAFFYAIGLAAEPTRDPVSLLVIGVSLAAFLFFVLKLQQRDLDR